MSVRRWYQDKGGSGDFLDGDATAVSRLPHHPHACQTYPARNLFPFCETML